MRTIQEIELLDLTKLSDKERRQIRKDLETSYHHTSHKTLLTDGRNAKEVIGQQKTRFTLYAMSTI